MWLGAAYLFGLGVLAIARPADTRRFLSGFAQTIRANLIEMTLRFVVGLAFIGASGQTRFPILSVGFGLFLAASAILLALLPDLHRNFSSRATARMFAILPIFGLISILFAAVLAWFIA